MFPTPTHPPDCDRSDGQLAHPGNFDFPIRPARTRHADCWFSFRGGRFVWRSRIVGTSGAGEVTNAYFYPDLYIEDAPYRISGLPRYRGFCEVLLPGASGFRVFLFLAAYPRSGVFVRYLSIGIFLCRAVVLFPTDTGKYRKERNIENIRRPPVRSAYILRRPARSHVNHK